VADTSEPLHIAIAGAGISGLALAIALAGRGQRVDVYERAAAISEVGAGLQISPNGAAVLAGLGLAEAARAAAVPAQGIELFEQTGRSPVLRLDLTRARHGNPHPYLFLHRADLIALLKDRAEAAGARIHLDRKIDPAASLPGGADLLVGADGLHSAVRQRLNGTMAPFFTGQVAWRALVKGDGTMPPVARVWMAPGRHIVAYPLRGGSLINLVAVEERRSWVAEGWFHPDDPDNLRDAFSGFAPEVRALLARCGSVFVWGLFRHQVAATWHDDRMTIVGDAVHPTLPFLAQGANMGLEDAWVLASALAPHGRAVPRAELPLALSRYQAARIKRVTRIVEAAEANARTYHLRNPAARLALHTGLQLAGLVAPGAVLRRFDWLYGADVTRA
jgi:salicylate hydroxylase